jgi:hypothetical protein
LPPRAPDDAPMTAAVLAVAEITAPVLLVEMVPPPEIVAIAVGWL